MGYLNVYDRSDGREIRTIAVDPERADFVRLAFELYATGKYTLTDLSDELYDRGLHTRPTPRQPTQQVSLNKLSLMLRDRYYLGFVTHKGEEYDGRHEAIIDDDTFGRVQSILDSRTVASERRRVHHHFLKGSVFCGRCHDAGLTSRMIIQHVVNARGTAYTYFFCIAKQSRTCSTPHVNVIRVEDAVEEHYASIRFSPAFVDDVRARIAATLADEETATHLLKQQLTTQLRALDAQESNLIDLAADGTVPQAKIKQRLRDIDSERTHLSERLKTTNDELAYSVRLIEACLTLMSDPQELYRRCDDDQRRMLNQALFAKLFVYQDRISDHEMNEPFARVEAAHRAHGRNRSERSDKPDPGRPQTAPATGETRRAAPHPGGGSSIQNIVRDLLTDFVGCSSKPRQVELRGFEPLTSSMPWRRATNCAIAP